MAPGLIESLGRLTKTDVVPTMERNLDKLEIRYKWADSKAARMAGLFNIITGCTFLVPIAFISNIMLADGGDPIFLVFLTPFFASIAYFIYFGLAKLLNNGTISVDGENLVSMDRPLPLSLTKKVSTPKIMRVYASYIQRNTKDDSYRINVVRVMTNDGNDRIIDKGLSEGNAELFATEISKHLNLQEVPFPLDLGVITKEPGRLAIEYRPKDYTTSSNLGMLLFGMLWTGMVMFFFLSFFLAGPADLMFLPLMLPFILIGVFLLYYSLGHMRNRCSIVIDQGTLVARERPLPFAPTRRLSIEEVQEFTMSTLGSWSQSTNNHLEAFTKNGKYISIGQGLSEEQALMFVQEINDFLGIKRREEDPLAYKDGEAPGASVSQVRKRGMPTSAKLFIVFALIFSISIIGFFVIMTSDIFESQESGGLRIIEFNAYSYGDHIEYNVTIENTIGSEVTKTLKLSLNYQSVHSDSYESQFEHVTLAPYETRTYTFTFSHYCNGSEKVKCTFWNL